MKINHRKYELLGDFRLKVPITKSQMKCLSIKKSFFFVFIFLKIYLTISNIKENVIKKKIYNIKNGSYTIYTLHI